MCYQIASMARKKMTPRRVNQAKNQGTSNDQQVPKPIMQRRASTLVGRLKQRGSRAQTELFQTSDFRRSPKKVKRAAKNSRDANNNECSPSTSGVNVKSKSSVGKYDLVSQELQESIHKVGKCGYLIRPFLDRLMKVEESDKSSIWRRTENVTKTASFIHGDFNSGEPAVDGKSFILRYSDSRVKIRRWKVGAVGMFTITANTVRKLFFVNSEHC